MKVTAILATLLATSALAAPAPEAEVKSMAAQQTWTIQNMKRVCNKPDDKCDWSFTVAAPAGKTNCAFSVKKAGSTPASRSPGNGAKCGAYTVTSGWDGSFGEGKGFTTLSVVDYGKKQIAWPAYTDVQLKGGKVVKPDQSYPVQALP